MRFSGWFLLLSVGLAGSAMADVVVGTNNHCCNAFPFGDSYLGEYQQVYDSAQFSGIQTITGLKFATGTGFAGESHTLTLTISLSTTAATVASMSTNYAANKGADFTQVFSGPVSYTAVGNDTFDLSFTTTPFSYNPALGDLLMDVSVSSNSGNIVGFDFNQDSVTSRVFNLNGNGAATFDQGEGLVTDFVTSSTATPEPTGVSLVSLIVLLAGAVLRRRIA